MKWLQEIGKYILCEDRKISVLGKQDNLQTISASFRPVILSQRNKDINLWFVSDSVGARGAETEQGRELYCVVQWYSGVQPVMSSRYGYFFSYNSLIRI